MKLFIVPGGGDPEAEAYRKGFALIESQARRREYDEVFIFKFPGHFSLTGRNAAHNQKTAAQKVSRKLLQTEAAGVQYTIFARSYGCGVVMSVLLKHRLPNLQHILLWGPTPAIGIYEVTVYHQNAIKRAKREKGCFVDSSSYESCLPLDIQLLEYKGSHTLNLWSGTRDEHCRRTYFPFLRDYLGERADLKYSRVRVFVTRLPSIYLDLVFVINV